MGYNVCGICGACDGRAGVLVGNPVDGRVHACLNCHDTRTTGNVVIHAHLMRTDEEIAKTMNILSERSS